MAFKNGCIYRDRGGRLKLQNDKYITVKKWDAGIFFPDCTFLTTSANRWLKDQPKRLSGVLVGAARRVARKKAIAFFKKLYYCDIKKIAIENPIGCISSEFRKPCQIVQPWQFGHGEVKATCFWLRGFDLLKPTRIVSGRNDKIFRMSPNANRAKLRSKTYKGIARAMASQWF